MAAAAATKLRVFTELSAGYSLEALRSHRADLELVVNRHKEAEDG